MLDISAFEAVTHDKKPPGLTASAPDCCAGAPVPCDVFPGSNSSRNAFWRNAILHADNVLKPCYHFLMMDCLRETVQALQQTQGYGNAKTVDLHCRGT